MSMDASDPLIVSRVVGDVIDPFTRSISLKAAYRIQNEVRDGMTLAPSQVYTQPDVNIGGENVLNYYTLIMVDIDHPNKEYLLWLMTDIPEATGTPLGRELLRYENPDPIKGSPRRVVMILFRQIRKNIVHGSGLSRLNFNTRAFASFYRLGLPVAALYFNCRTLV